jgi:hypothetical protein
MILPLEASKEEKYRPNKKVYYLRHEENAQILRQGNGGIEFTYFDTRDFKALSSYRISASPPYILAYA